MRSPLLIVFIGISAFVHSIPSISRAEGNDDKFSSYKDSYYNEFYHYNRKFFFENDEFRENLRKIGFCLNTLSPYKDECLLPISEPGLGWREGFLKNSWVRFRDAFHQNNENYMVDGGGDFNIGSSLIFLNLDEECKNKKIRDEFYKKNLCDIVKYKNFSYEYIREANKYELIFIVLLLINANGPDSLNIKFEEILNQKYEKILEYSSELEEFDESVREFSYQILCLINKNTCDKKLSETLYRIPSFRVFYSYVVLRWKYRKIISSNDYNLSFHFGYSNFVLRMSHILSMAAAFDQVKAERDILFVLNEVSMKRMK